MLITMYALDDIRAQRLLTRVLLVLTLVCWAGVSNESVVGQTAEKSLLDRIAERVSANEPAFKLVFKRKPTGEDVSNNLGWKLEDDFVSATFYELAPPEDAATHLLAMINAPVSVISETLKFEGLADEAYIRGPGPYSKPGYTSLFFRKRNVVATLSASSQDLAMRFARHMADEIGGQ